MKTGLIFSSLAALALGLAAGCNYDAPLTVNPTHRVDPRLLGEWIQPDEHDWMIVRALDDSHYVVAYGKEQAGERPDLYRAFHSDFAGLPFVSIQNLQPGDDYGQYVYMTWSLSADGQQLTLHTVNTKVLPESSGDAAAQQKIVAAHAQDPALFNEPMVFVRPAPPKP